MKQPSKPSEWVQIEFLKDCVRSGKSREMAFQEFSKLFKKGKGLTTDRTIDNRWKIAKQAISDEQAYISSKVNEGIELAIKERTGKIMTILERQEFLTATTRGELRTEKIIGYEILTNENGKKVPQVIRTPDQPNHNDRIKALAELNKMEGSYAPAKTEVKVEGVIPLPLAITNASLDELRELIKAEDNPGSKD